MPSQRQKERSKQYLLFKYNYKCIYCGDKKDLTMDHVFPRALGGSWKRENLVLSCVHCNRAKGDMLLTDFIKRFKIKMTRKIADLL